MSTHVQKPGWFTVNVFNRAVAWFTRRGAAGGGELRLGKKVDVFTATEVTGDDKVPLLRAYLKRWKAEVGVFFGGVGPDSSDDELRGIADDHPVFHVTVRN